jgi:hypothetical protein
MKWRYKLKFWFAKTVYKLKDDETPILMEKYVNNDYYYILNNNDHYVYSLDEVYELTITTKKDPITRSLIFNHSIVKVRLY